MGDDFPCEGPEPLTFRDWCPAGYEEQEQEDGCIPRQFAVVFRYPPSPAVQCFDARQLAAWFAQSRSLKNPLTNRNLTDAQYTEFINVLDRNNLNHPRRNLVDIFVQRMDEFLQGFLMAHNVFANVIIRDIGIVRFFLIAMFTSFLAILQDPIALRQIQESRLFRLVLQFFLSYLNFAAEEVQDDTEEFFFRLLLTSFVIYLTIQLAIRPKVLFTILILLISYGLFFELEGGNSQSKMIQDAAKIAMEYETLQKSLIRSL